MFPIWDANKSAKNISLDKVGFDDGSVASVIFIFVRRMKSDAFEHRFISRLVNKFVSPVELNQLEELHLDVSIFGKFTVLFFCEIQIKKYESRHRK